MKDIKLKAHNYVFALENLQELIYYIQAITSATGLQNNYYVNVIFLYEFSQQLNRFHTRFQQLFSENDELKKSEIALLLQNHHATFMTMVSEVLGENFDTEYVLSLKSPLLVENIVNLLQSTLETIQHSDSESYASIYKNITNIGMDLFDLFRDSPSGGSLPAKLLVFVTMLLKELYANGETQYLVRIFGNNDISSSVSSKTPIEIMARATVPISTIIDFYRFSSFCLVELSNLDENTIIEAYNIQAQEYLDVLLQIPSLNLHLFQALDIDIPNSTKVNWVENSTLISLTEREEISLIYILNYLLSLTRIEQLTTPTPSFTAELLFLLKSLRFSLSSDIRQQSLPNSRSSSVSSLFQMQSQETTRPHIEILISNPSSRCLTSIILDGSYLEKVNLVLGFLTFLSRPTLDLRKIISSCNRESRLSSNFKHSLSLLEESEYGKHKYVVAINTITKLLALLSLKAMVDGIGMNNLPRSQLETKFDIPLDSIFSVKNLLQYSVTLNSNGEEVFQFNTLKPLPSSISQQLGIHDEILATTNLLHTASSVLKP